MASFLTLIDHVGLAFPLKLLKEINMNSTIKFDAYIDRQNRTGFRKNVINTERFYSIMYTSCVLGITITFEVITKESKNAIRSKQGQAGDG